MNWLLTAFNMFSGPVSGIVEKTILGGVAYGVGKGVIPTDSAAGLAAAAYALVSAAFTAVTKSTTGKALSLNSADNGLSVVPTSTAVAANIKPVTPTTMPVGFGG